MLIEAIEKPFTCRWPGGEIRLVPGKPVDLPEARALRLLNKAGGRVRVCAPNAPTAPLHPGWLVVYRNTAGRLCGGADDRLHGTVHRCLWDGNDWSLSLTDGQRLPLRAITSVGRTDTEGRVVAAWDVRGCGFDGEGRRT